jgi:anti-sigma regulatory factor (Ser/Thr protein kinase)
LGPPVERPPVEQELRIAAGPSGLASARDYAADAATEFGLDDAERFDVVLAVHEAVSNAMRHGAPDELGHIRLEANVGPERLTFTVHDSGEFRQPAAAPPDADHGRGLEMIGVLMDEVVITIGPAGTTIRLSRLRR